MRLVQMVSGSFPAWKRKKHWAGAPEGVAARAFYQRRGFVPGKLSVEFGSEVQEFVLDEVRP